ncbi:transmembrane protein 214-A-like isoform X2 [Centruroides sculpturatus]|nr:transmembrane protein 214-A-like isoform X2 [Centruroides sculpturatus]
MSSWKFPWRHFIIFLFFGIGTFLIYDINLYGSFERSRSGKFLKESGILNACEQARGRITSYSQKSLEWLNKNVPVYYSKACNICRPYLELFWENFFLFCEYVWDSTADIREWLIIKIPPILDWLSEHIPLYVEKIVRFISEIGEILYQYITLFTKYTLYYFDIAGRWLQENVFSGKLSPENLQRYAVHTIELIQQYTMSVLHWCSQQLSSIMSNK